MSPKEYKMKNHRLIKIAVLPIVLLLFQSSGKVQTIGNPVVLENNTWGVGISADRIKYDLDGHQYLSTRALLNASFSVSEFFDLTFIAGMGNMNIRFPDERARTNFDAKNSIAVGGSAKIYQSIPELKNFKVMGELGVI